MRRILFVIITAMTFLAQAGTITVESGGVPLENIFKKIEEPFEKENPGINLELIRGTIRTSLENVENGKVTGGSVAFPMDEWLKKAEKNFQYKPVDASVFKHRVIGKDLMFVMVNKENPILKFDKITLTKIFSGAVKNWKEVGGADLPIKVIISDNVPGMNDFFQEAAMGGAAYATTARHVKLEIPELKLEIAKTPEAIALVPSGAKDESIKIVKTDDIGRPITFVTKGEPNVETKKLLDFIDKEGRKYIK